MRSAMADISTAHQLPRSLMDDLAVILGGSAVLTAVGFNSLRLHLQTRAVGRPEYRVGGFAIE